MSRLPLALLLACPLGQACAPLVFELPHDDPPTTLTEPLSTGGEPTTGGTTLDPDPTHSGPDGGPGGGPDSSGFSCQDGAPGPGETDIDCGGPCPPCKPGAHCEFPSDCELGDCFAGICGERQCHDITDCPPAGPCELQNCLPSGVCEPSPRKDGEFCDDGDQCTQKDTCLAGKCTPNFKTDCSALEGPCRTGVCNPVTGNCAVEWTFEGQPCEDGDKCTQGELCSGGECLAPPHKPPVLFTDFSLAGGWIAEPPWQIGPAVASQCAIPNADDPGADHSPSADNHVAGAAIGDCLPTEPFPEACLESPAVDVSDFPGPLSLGFFDIIASASPDMQSRVDVFDGEKQAWFPLIAVPGPVFFTEWTEHSEDLSPFKSKQLRVRFCQRSDGPSPPVGGWSIDDLSIGPPACAP